MTTEILRFEYGSRAHGTGTEDSDHDYMSIVVEPPESVIGLGTTRTVHSSTAPEGARSGAGDTDTTVYPLRQFAKLAAKGNPTVLTAFFTKAEFASAEGRHLVNSAPYFISKEAGMRFLGYAMSQRKALTGQRNKRTNRPELVHKHGYDTKFAYHMVRLQLQGIELMKTHALDLPMKDVNLGLLQSIRAGSIVKDSVLALSENLDNDLKKAIDESTLPEKADVDKINEMLLDIHMDIWGYEPEGYHWEEEDD